MQINHKVPFISYVVMGAGCITSGQIGRGLCFFSAELCFIIYMVLTGWRSLAGLITLGTHQQQMVYNGTTGLMEVIRGDNSMRMLLSGIAALTVCVLFLRLYYASIQLQRSDIKLKENGKKLPSFKEDIASLLNGNLHRTLLFIPFTGLTLFTVIPLVYMVLMAFTNYDVHHQPPGNLFTWVGLENFKTLLLSGSKIARTFWPIFSWTIIWAFCATFSCYFGGMALALLINMKGIKFKKFWRSLFVVSIAVPSFVSLLIIRVMLQPSGAVNILLQEAGFITKALPFFTEPLWARVTVIVVNMWVGIPFSMLITTGLLYNIPAELYESARMDGAGALRQFIHITMPYMFFSTGPYLISNFIANINNFNAVYFLTGGGPATLEYFKGAGKTDLLVTWLFKLTVDSKDYCYAAAIGIVIFTVSALLSSIIYRRSAAYVNEGAFQV
jgi:fructose-bisphosphate aldolase